MNDKKVAIHYSAALESWIEFFVIVDADDRDAAEAAARRAVDAYWKSDDLCYGDVVKSELEAAGLAYSLKLCEYDEASDEPTEKWAAECVAIYLRMPVVEI